jgi:hypothetical protein
MLQARNIAQKYFHGNKINAFIAQVWHNLLLQLLPAAKIHVPFCPRPGRCPMTASKDGPEARQIQVLPVEPDPTLYPNGVDAATKLLAAVGSRELLNRRSDARYGRRIAALQNRIATLVAARDAEAALHRDYISSGLSTLARWYRNNVKRLGNGRTIALASGDLKGDLDKSWSMHVSGEPGVAVQKIRRHGEQFLRVVVTPSATAIIPAKTRFRRVRELTFTRHDRFRAVPNNLGDTTPPKEDRLSLILSTSTYPTRRNPVRDTPADSA